MDEEGDITSVHRPRTKRNSSNPHPQSGGVVGTCITLFKYPFEGFACTWRVLICVRVDWRIIKNGLAVDQK
ncbi:hypothetical protein TNCV_577761 [Trichonephila clavipes]|nr:hypothetical protein TNCV_577761 [Trichonephila clavipes]